MENSPSDSSVFSVRIVSIDHYMSPPIPGLDISYSSFQGGKVNEVPVIRIYGSTPAGQKTCLHVHRALPYLYVPCSDLLLHPDQEGDASTHILSLALEKALKLKGSVGSKRQHVHSCSLVRARKYYGYHKSEELFAKIYLYHPQDVSRAASLLLGGAILDKCLQPHESHVPFLLQFLVDCNLHGMGHLHVSKMKFRHPVPEAFCSRKASYNRPYEQTDDTSFVSAASQADSRGDSCSGSPIWLSSTIPDGWFWKFPSQDQDIPLVKRQSVCELEGDATVEDILNQQVKLYSSLSQTLSDVKMVQSLIPIWEEFESNGRHGATAPPASVKPLPEIVLKTLSDGLEFESKLMELGNNAENSSPFLFENGRIFSQTVKSSIDQTYVVDVGQTNFEVDISEHMMISKANDVSGMLLSQDLARKGDDGADNGQEKDACPQQLSTSGSQSSDAIGPSNMKAADQEALRLLKWLASSQAAEDINSDDELVRETILSPLLPETTIDKVLEKADMDFESASLQECQDILDSVEDPIDVEGKKERDFRSPSKDHCYSCQISSTLTIPQVDGSSDDQNLNYIAGKSSTVETRGECEKSPQEWVQHDIGSSFTRKNKRKGPLWASLPFTSSEKVIDDLQTAREESVGRCCDIVMGDTVKDSCSTKAESTIVGYSMRDLMRRKRTHRGEPLECETPLKLSSNEEPKDDSFSCTLWGADGHDSRPLSSSSNSKSFLIDERAYLHEKKMDVEPFEVQVCGEACDSKFNDSFCSTPGKQPLLANNNVMLSSPSNCGRFRFVEVADNVVVSETTAGSGNLIIPGPPSGHRETEKNSHLINPENQESEVQIGPCKDTTPLGSGNHGRDTCIAGPSNSESAGVNTASNTMEAIGLSFFVKPPVIQWTDEPSRDASLPATIPDCPSPADEEKYEGSVEEGLGEECLPFFMGDCLEEKEILDTSGRINNTNNQREGVMGIPTYYHNDGSCLYMLTPAISPPSRDFFRPFNLGNAASLESSSSKRPILGQIKKEDQGSHVTSVQPSHTEMATVSETEGNFMDAKPCAVFSQDISQISGPDAKSKLTPLSQTGFRDPASVGGGQQLTLFSIEVLAESRGDLRPDPRFDAINLIVLILQEDDDSIFDAYILLRSDIHPVKSNLDATTGCKLLVSSEEKHLLSNFVKIICSFDPDILMGWDIQGGSLGFLAERAAHLGIGLLNSISRTPSPTNGNARESSGIASEVHSESIISDPVQHEDAIIEDEWGRTHASGVHVGGRIVLNVWRLIRGEVKLNMYTAEAVAEAVLRQKIPFIHWKILTKWFSSGPGRARYRCIEYFLERAKLNLQIMNHLDMINRTSELARVFGIDFFSVLSRGSQFRVESMLLRLAHTQNYLAISPGSQQVASQPAMECIPLVMEPESGFYADPVVVLDFQSLYPSMIIAYNLCFSTCLGKVTPPKPNTLGVSSYSPDLNVLRDVKHEILLTPNGVMYVPSKVREGVLPRLLDEILSTRIMVKQAMKKLAPSQQVLKRLFNARQLALKLIANVTYGYTAAGFSGRMPCAELADSIVQCGRRTLENAISFVNTHDKWKAKVIYGDTDSMFVLLAGRSVSEAFQIGNEIASAVTAMNPIPVTLKMEKVYHPCFLLTKKRYVGYSYETPAQVKPVFDAKGIETIRRDTCGAVSKTMEQSLRIFFEHQDINKVKSFLLRQWKRILSGRVSLPDFIFAKEVRLGTYSTRVSSLPPAAIVATKAMRADPRAEPRYGERIPYVVVHGEPGARLADMVVDPLDLLSLDSPFRLNDLYYINKQIIPALQRVFGLVGADLNQWFWDMPRSVREAVGKRKSFAPNSHRTRIDSYYLSKHCILCGELVQASAQICDRCSKNEATVATVVTGRTSKLEREMQHLAAVCRHCGGGDWLIESGVKCTSLACSVFYERRKVQKELQSLSSVATGSGFYPKCMVEWF